MASFVSKIFGSVIVRLALIFGALATMTAAAIGIGWVVFQSMAMGMSTLYDQKLPELRQSAAVVVGTELTRNALVELLIAPDQEAVGRASAQAIEASSELKASIQPLPEVSRTSLQGLVTEVSLSLQTLSAARNDEFASAESMMAAVENVMILSTEAAGLLEEASDDAYFELVLSGEETIETLGQTLTSLIEDHFTLYQTTLGVKAEINLLAGLALSRSQVNDLAVASILDDLSNAANSRLEAMLNIISQAPATQQLAAAVMAERPKLVGRVTKASSNEILSIRQDIDAELSSALDDIYFDLVISSDDAKTLNEGSVRRLLDEQVTQIRKKAALSIATKSYFSSVLQVALARDDVELASKADGLSLSRQQLVDAMEAQETEIIEKLNAILGISNPETGIVAIRKMAFSAKVTAAEASRNAADAVRDIANKVSAFSAVTQSHIEDTAYGLSQEVLLARSRMRDIGAISLAIVAIAPFLIWLMITRPLVHVTKTTERLANGDLSEIMGLDRSKGEIGRMASALKVFRNGALDRIRLQREEKQRAIDVVEMERKAEREQQQASERAREAKLHQEQEERRKAAEEATREETIRGEADAERQARTHEQELVVAELAQSLQRLSAGDLTQKIQTEFPGSYEALRQDYNAAIDNLSALIRKISDSSGMIDGSSSEIAMSSLDLSRRTENSAATLEQTATALNELTESVSSAAHGAADAARTVENVRARVEISHETMGQAVVAMEEIKESSSKISKIVEVIDAIAFQTNLLALNAGVEAARAGEAGLGFGVVASEVRGLAHKCSEAALEINELISNGSVQVERGVSLVGQTSTALETILTGVLGVSQHVSRIAVSAEEQSSGINEINSSVSQLDSTTQQNAAMFEETTAANQALTDEARHLAQIVAGFSISDQGEEWVLPQAVQQTSAA